MFTLALHAGAAAVIPAVIASRIALYLVENMRYAPDPLEQFVYCTQLMQGECLASAYRLWKREWRGPAHPMSMTSTNETTPYVTRCSGMPSLHLKRLEVCRRAPLSARSALSR